MSHYNRYEYNTRFRFDRKTITAKCLCTVIMCELPETRSLIDSGANIHARTLYGDYLTGTDPYVNAPMLYAACCAHNEEIVYMLLTYGADPHAKCYIKNEDPADAKSIIEYVDDWIQFIEIQIDDEPSPVTDEMHNSEMKMLQDELKSLRNIASMMSEEVSVIKSRWERLSAWERGEMEKPAGEEQIGPASFRIFYTQKQKERLGLDEFGNKLVDTDETPSVSQDSEILSEIIDPKIIKDFVDQCVKTWIRHSEECKFDDALFRERWELCDYQKLILEARRRRNWTNIVERSQEIGHSDATCACCNTAWKNLSGAGELAHDARVARTRRFRKGWPAMLSEGMEPMDDETFNDLIQAHVDRGGKITKEICAMIRTEDLQNELQLRNLAEAEHQRWLQIQRRDLAETEQAHQDSNN